MPTHRLFGLAVASVRPLPGPTVSAPADLIITEHDGRLRRQPENQRGYVYTRGADGTVRVSWNDLFDFVVSADGSRIDVHADATRHREPVYTYLLSQVISVALLSKNIESLHASAVAWQNRAYVFLGHSGAGKSTLTAALVHHGARLLTDDLLVLTDHHEVAPGAHRIKLDPDTAAQLGIAWPSVPMEDGSGKAVLQLPPERCAHAAVPLAGIFVLAPHADHCMVEDMSAQEATRELLAATFNPLRTDAPRLSGLLRNAQQLAAQGAVRRLHVPRDFARLDDVARLLFE